MFEESRSLVLDELTRSLAYVKPEEFNRLLDEIMLPRRVLAVGVGRVLISMKAWVKRLVHLDIDINYVGSETERPVDTGDLLIVASSSGESMFPAGIAKIARQKGAKVAYIGCTPDSTAAGLSDFKLILPGRTKFARTGEFVSVQPMSTLFEQQLYLLGDILTLEVMHRKGWSETDIKNRHANLE